MTNWLANCFILISRQWFERFCIELRYRSFKPSNRGISVSNNETGFIKILFVILVLGASNSFFGCAENRSQIYSDAIEESKHQEILNGFEVTDQNPISKKVLYLATGAKLLKTPNGGFKASQTGQCSASAISPQIILTAAHCLKAMNPKDDQTTNSIYIVLGTKPWKSKFNPKFWFAAEKIVIHPKYKKSITGGSPDDLALIKLKSPLPTDYVTDLADAKDLQSSMAFIMAGFGLRNNMNGLSDFEKLQNIGELFQTSKLITNYDPNNLTIEIDQRDQKGICTGDSGGPGLILNSVTKKYTTIGVLSAYRWTENEQQILDTQNKIDCLGYAVYTNVMNPEYYEWIQKEKLLMQ